MAFASCVAVPITVMLSLQRISIDLSCDKTELFYLVNFKRNERDLNSNVSHYSGRQIQKIIQMLTVTRKLYNQLMQER